jgi:cytochrome c553
MPMSATGIVPAPRPEGATMQLHNLLFIALAALPLAATAQTAAAPPGRLLASNCFQCHGTDGRGGFDKLTGESASEIYNELREMRAENKPGNIMNRHAAGYTDAQLKLIAEYFATRR